MDYSAINNGCNSGCDGLEETATSKGETKMITKLLGLVVFSDGVANIVWFKYHDKDQKHHRKYQLGRLIRVLIGITLILV